MGKKESVRKGECSQKGATVKFDFHRNRHENAFQQGSDLIPYVDILPSAKEVTGVTA